MEQKAREKTVLPNLAERPDADVFVKHEAQLAGIRIVEFDFVLGGSEVPTKCLGLFGPWSFKRAWRYWVAEGPGLPVGIAERLHEEFGKEVRVAGHAGGLHPRAAYQGFGVPSYHVDTLEGLRALVAALRSVHDPDKPLCNWCNLDEAEHWRIGCVHPWEKEETGA